jgi:sec-independent protein translocase protein TatC
MTTKQDQEATLISHLEALRRALIRSLVALAVGIVPLFLVSPYVLDWFCEQIKLQGGISLHYFSPMEVFLLQLKISALLDCVLFSPYIAWNIWQFVLPALYEKEKRFVRSIVGLTSFLFVAGVAFCLLVCFPLIVEFGMSFAGESLTPVFGVSNLVSLALWLSLAFGCMFQFPLVTYALIRGGIVSYETVCDKRPYVVVGILAVAALLTPPDVVSQLILGAPTYLLFEAGLFAARRFKRKTR